jgi:hypothetical protein
VADAKHTVHIDISAKLEEWMKSSFIAVGNGVTRVLMIRADVKVAALRYLPAGEKPQFALMAILTYIAIKPNLHQIRGVVLDRDYSGNAAKRIITRRLVELIRRDVPTFKAASIKIDNIAGSEADQLARDAFKGERQVDGEITLSDIIDAM